MEGGLSVGGYMRTCLHGCATGVCVCCVSGDC